MQSIASEIAKNARKNAPKDDGDLKKAIKAKRRRSKPMRPVSDVVIMKDKSKIDAFYWIFQEYGTVKDPDGRPFLGPAVDKVNGKIGEIIDNNFINIIRKMIKRELKKNG